MANLAEVVGAVVEQYLSCFVVLGYDDDGNHIQVTSMRTPKDAAAIATILQYAADNINCMSEDGEEFVINEEEENE